MDERRGFLTLSDFPDKEVSRFGVSRFKHKLVEAHSKTVGWRFLDDYELKVYTSDLNLHPDKQIYKTMNLGPQYITRAALLYYRTAFPESDVTAFDRAVQHYGFGMPRAYPEMRIDLVPLEDYHEEIPEGFEEYRRGVRDSPPGWIDGQSITQVFGNEAEDRSRLHRMAQAQASSTSSILPTSPFPSPHQASRPNTRLSARRNTDNTSLLQPGKKSTSKPKKRSLPHDQDLDVNPKAPKRQAPDAVPSPKVQLKGRVELPTPDKLAQRQRQSIADDPFIKELVQKIKKQSAQLDTTTMKLQETDVKLHETTSKLEAVITAAAKDKTELHKMTQELHELRDAHAKMKSHQEQRDAEFEQMNTDLNEARAMIVYLTNALTS